MQKLPAIDYQNGLRLIGHSDIAGRPDGGQIMVHKGHAFIGHVFSSGFSVVDVRDPARPAAVAHVPAPANTWNGHLQTHDDLLLVINSKNLFAEKEFDDERNYYKGDIGRKVGTAESGGVSRNWTAGLSVFDISQPASPRQIGFMPVSGGGIHRLWYTGGRWAYASALLDGFSDYVFVIIDLNDPTRPVLTSRFWLPGMNLAAGETPTWPNDLRYGLHHPIVHDDTAYLAWRDAGMVVLDVSDRSTPKLISHTQWSPPFGGGTHNCLPLPDRNLAVVLDEAVLDHQEDGEKFIWMFDMRCPARPVGISTLPSPADADYKRKPGHFGPHNLHENRPGSHVSSQLVFATYQNAGVRIFDISDAYRPKEIAALVPSAPAKSMDVRSGRPLVIQNADVFVDQRQIIYSTDYSGGLYVMERA